MTISLQYLLVHYVLVCRNFATLTHYLRLLVACRDARVEAAHRGIGAFAFPTVQLLSTFLVGLYLSACQNMCEHEGT